MRQQGMNEHFIPRLVDMHVYAYACICNVSTLTSEGTVGQACTLNLHVCILLSVTSMHSFVHAVSTTLAAILINRSLLQGPALHFVL